MPVPVRGPGTVQRGPHSLTTDLTARACPLPAPLRAQPVPDLPSDSYRYIVDLSENEKEFSRLQNIASEDARERRCVERCTKKRPGARTRRKAGGRRIAAAAGGPGTGA